MKQYLILAVAIALLAISQNTHENCFNPAKITQTTELIFICSITAKSQQPRKSEPSGKQLNVSTNSFLLYIQKREIKALLPIMILQTIEKISIINPQKYDSNNKKTI